MKRTHRSMYGAVILTLLIGISGCANTKNGSEEYLEGIRWLTASLQKHGVFVTERGSAGLEIPAESSSRLILNRRDVVDVYAFDDKNMAAAEAFEFAGSHPGNDVYLRNDLVIVRYSEGDTGLNKTLYASTVD